MTPDARSLHNSPHCWLNKYDLPISSGNDRRHSWNGSKRNVFGRAVTSNMHAANQEMVCLRPRPAWQGMTTRREIDSEMAVQHSGEEALDRIQPVRQIT